MRIGFSNIKGKIKMVGLILLGVGVIGLAATGITKLVQYTREDLKTINPSFEIGSLNSVGEYEKDSSRLYTEKSFACDGLQVKLDFDNEINYQIFFYDDLGNFIESTEVYKTGESITPMGSYARCVITPTNDEDGKISLIERVKYSSQMTFKVAKKQELKTFKIGNKTFVSTSDTSNLLFERGGFSIHDGELVYDFSEEWVCSTKQILSVKKGNVFSINSNETYKPYYNFYKFKLNDKGNLVLVGSTCTNDFEEKIYVVESGVDYILIDASIMNEEGHFVLQDTDIKNISTSLIFKAR